MRNSTFLTRLTSVVILVLFSSSPLHADFQKGFDQVKPILEKYCHDCHDNDKHKGGLNFEKFKVEKDILVHLQQWFSVIDQVETGVMPPEKKKLRPSAEEKIKLVSWVRKTIDEFDYDSIKDPGKFTLRRLNKAEYNNTIRDLTGIDLKPAQYFSGDGSGGEGFDNNAEGMTMLPLMVEKYFKAARDISRHAQASYADGIQFSPELSPTHTPQAYLILVERKLTNFYNDFFDKLPKYSSRKEYKPYLMPAMKLALAKPQASDREIYDAAIKEKLMPGVFYKWYIAFAHADEDIKSSRWDSHYGKWVLEPWLALQAKRESFTADELKQVHHDFSEKVRLSIPATGMMIKTSMEVKTKIKENAKVLYVSVGDMGDGNEFDHIVLHQPQIKLKNGKVVNLADLELIEKQGEGQIHKEKFPDGKTFVSSAAKKIEHGYYIEAPALLSFKLPQGAKSFTATMGMEKSAQGKGSVQAYASDEKIPFPKGKHTHSYFYSGPGLVSVEAAKKWWVIYSSLVGYGKGAGAKEMVDVSLDEKNKKKLASIRSEIEFAKREAIKSFFTFVSKKGFAKLLKTKKGELPALADLDPKDRNAPAKLSKADQKKWTELKNAAQSFQKKIDDDLHANLLAFASKTFRRPLNKEEAQVVTAIYRKSISTKDDFQKAVQLVIQSLLTQPQFLFRFEDDRPGKSAQQIGDFALANRLSYFLWSSMPDETLMRHAAEGKLQDDKVLETQVRRMLKDPKSISLAQEFASQWLGFRKILGEKEPDLKLFPTYTKELKDSMYQEAILSFDELVKQDKSVLQILDSKSTYLNEALAKHYGIAGVTGKQMRQVDLKNNQRGGFLSMGSMLVATSFPGRTSPVIRGQWVLDALIGGKVPPAPDGLVIDRAKLNNESLSIKERLAEHRNNPNCSVCHERMDPLGFALENFDAVGRFRSQGKNGKPIDSVSDLNGGLKLEGIAGLKQYLKTTKQDAFLHQMAQKNLGFALGRSLQYYDESVIRASVANLKKNDLRFSALVLTIVKSYPFRYKREKGHLTDAN
ncbi:MAG: DUF1592 domain-containing protein [Verrucomicrobiota bacterium]